jgi:glycolate oxidase FAD binding subunit
VRPADVEALRKAAGDAALEEHAPVDVDGTALGWTLRPGDGEALVRAVRALAERRLGAVLRGGGSKLGFGNPPRGAALLLSTAALAGVLELDAEEGVVRARSGTRLAELREALRETGWELPFDPPGAHATLGGTLATAAVGPRHLGFGRPRDLVLGLEAVLGDGVRARCGGRVVKNVTGYDLMKLQIGALGSLGVIESAWIRLCARPECERVMSAALGPRPDAAARGLAAARLASARAVALVDPILAPAVEPGLAPRAGFLLVVELAGDEAAAARDAARLAAELGAVEGSPGAIARLRALQGEAFGPVGLRFRLAVLPDRLDPASAALTEAGAELLLHPGSGLIFARFALEPESDAARVDRAWSAVRRAARGGGGHAVLEAAPAWAKPVRDVFGDPPDAIALVRALKQRFDPARVLNPGRFAGGL